jgi:tetratricopeptide (TPR) repeat protein
MLALGLLFFSDVLWGASTDCVKTPEHAECGAKGISLQSETAQGAAPKEPRLGERQELLERIITLNRLAETLRAAGRYAECEPLYRQALDLCRNLNSQDPNTGVILSNLAELYRVQGRLEEADLLYRQALERLERTLGGEHLFVATVLNNWA